MYASHLNQAMCSGSAGGRDLVLLHVVEAAAVDLPQLAADAVAHVVRALRLLERLVEQDEVEGGADPGDRSDHVQPADQQVEPVRPVRVEEGPGHAHARCHRSIAIATSSCSAVSSSSSVGLPIRLFSTSRISAFGPPVHEDDEAEAVPRLVLGVEAGELGQRLGVGVAPLLGRRAGREPRLLADRRVRVEHLVLLGVGEPVDDLERVAERVLALGEQLDEARPALEELGELVGAQLPR